MLRTLVKKLKSQSLNENEDGGDASQASGVESDEVFLTGPDRGGSGAGTNVSEKLETNRKQSGGTGSSPAVNPSELKEQEGCYSDKDSGTESDDEELEHIETTSTHSYPVSQTSDYYASQQSLSLASCRSQNGSRPSSPASSNQTANFFNGFNSDDQESNSWDSMGCESGIVLRESDPETPTPTELLYQQNSLRQILIKQQQGSGGEYNNIHKALGMNGFSQHQPQRQTSGSLVGGAFRPVPRRQTSLPETRAQAGAAVTRSKTGSLGSSSLETAFATRESRGRSSSTGEKRKWSQIHQNLKRNLLEFKPPSEMQVENRETLAAARRTPVKLLIAPGLETIKGEDQTEEFASWDTGCSEELDENLTTATSGIPPNSGRLSFVGALSVATTDVSSTGCIRKVSPRKKCRPDLLLSPPGNRDDTTVISSSVPEAPGTDAITEGSDPSECPGRPSLNFEKMREGWNSGYLLRNSRNTPGNSGRNAECSGHLDCLFRPVDPADDLGVADSTLARTPTGESTGFSHSPTTDL